jgi:hypothetical protein
MRWTFTVLPGGASFPTAELPGPETNEAYFHAHLRAAQQAAELKIASWVVRDDTGDEKYGFGRDAFLTPTTVLYQITQMGLGSFWDYATGCWLPLPAEKARAELDVPLETV